jgi:hypothetical protein
MDGKFIRSFVIFCGGQEEKDFTSNKRVFKLGKP